MPLDMPREISSNRVVLRCPCTENTSKLFTLVDHNRGHLSPYLDWVDHTKSTADSNEYLTKCQEMWEKGTKFDYSIFLKDTDEIIGQIGLFSIEEDHNHAEIGYWISSSYQGRGLCIVWKSVYMLITNVRSQWRVAVVLRKRALLVSANGCVMFIVIMLFWRV
jgi:hypothetical protein